MQIGIGSITAFMIAVLGYAVIRGDTHPRPEYTPLAIHTVDVCASVAEKLDEITDVETYYQGLCYPGVESIAVANCAGDPRPGHVQIRREGDMAGLSDHFRPSMRDDEASELYDLIGIDWARDRAVVYWAPYGDLHCTPKHLWGHVKGLRHTSAATSIMAGEGDGGLGAIPCGNSPALIDRCDLTPAD